MKVSKNQYIKDVVSEIQTNVILYKVLTGLGATSLELTCKRNSLLIEPNVPVIIGKSKGNKKILGVYEGVTIDKIIEYLLSSITPKKILVTPESLFKVKEAASVTGVNLFEEFFLLFDECDRIIKDAKFRRAITLPMDDFFAFNRKAFVSATPLEPSDPRFKDQGFKKVVIKPDFDFRKEIDLLITNNVFLSLQNVLQEINSENVCIFLNSTTLIASYLKKLELKGKSHVFCSREATYQLRYSDFKASEKLGDFQQYNVFTSRFYSAVDVHMDKKPTVIMVTDQINIDHTMIDPVTDAVQIVGRFRNGVDKIIHITNVNPELEPMSKEETLGYLSGCERSYNDIRALRNSATSEGAEDTLDEALRLVPYANFINEDGSKNYFMQDNLVNEERIRSYYKSKENLIQAYKKSKHFKPNVRTDEFSLSDIENSKLTSGISFNAIANVVVNTLRIILDNSMPYSLNNQTVLAELNKAFPLIVKAYRELGEETLLKNCYSKKQLERCLEKKRKTEEKSNFGFLRTLQSEFPDGITLPSREVKALLKSAISKHGLY